MTAERRPDPIATRIVRGAPVRDSLLAQVRGWLVTDRQPLQLIIVQVGDDPASGAYIRNKVTACAAVNLPCRVVHVDPHAGEAAFHQTLRQLAMDPSVTAIIPQTPLPAGWDARAAIELIPAAKDCDGLTTTNARLRAANDAAAILPATPLGVLRLLTTLGVTLPDLPVAVIGRGMVVGQPLSEMLAQAGARVVSIDKETPEPAALCRDAKVICAAAGVPGLVTANWVQPCAVVVDIGITRVGDRLMGDVDADSVEGLAAVRTPVPGGVGPLTVGSLLTNVIDCACVQKGLARPKWQVQHV